MMISAVTAFHTAVWNGEPVTEYSWKQTGAPGASSSRTRRRQASASGTLRIP